MRIVSTGPLLLLLGAALTGCSGGRDAEPGSTAPAKDVQAWVTVEVPGMT